MWETFKSLLLRDFEKSLRCDRLLKVSHWEIFKSLSIILWETLKNLSKVFERLWKVSQLRRGYLLMREVSLRNQMKNYYFTFSAGNYSPSSILGIRAPSHPPPRRAKRPRVSEIKSKPNKQWFKLLALSKPIIQWRWFLTFKEVENFWLIVLLIFNELLHCDTFSIFYIIF